MTTRIAISAICAVLAILHLLYPTVQVDLVTTVLLIVGILPWLASVIRSVELPGGFKIELQDVKTATEKVTSGKAADEARTLPLARSSESLDFLREVAKGDPNLALVGLRIEIERRLVLLAERASITPVRRSAGVLLRELVLNEKLDRQTASGLGELIALGNQAAHGADVSSSAAIWALDTGPAILQLLDSLIE